MQPVSICSNLIETYLAGIFDWPLCKLKIFDASSYHRVMKILQRINLLTKIPSIEIIHLILVAECVATNLQSQLPSTKREKSNKKVILIRHVV